MGERRMNQKTIGLIICIFIVLAGCLTACGVGEGLSPAERIPVSERSAADWIVIGAREEVKNRTIYDASYVVLDYPGGDVPKDRGACTDVVIRALRKAGYDLQQLIHEDMAAHFQEYPDRWGLDAPDPNIDHRRVPNQMTFFIRYGDSLPVDTTDHLDEWHWGDVVVWQRPDGLYHTGIVSDRTRSDGIPLVIHNAWMAVEEDALTRWTIVGHYRYPKSAE